MLTFSFEPNQLPQILNDIKKKSRQSLYRGMRHGHRKAGVLFRKEARRSLKIRADALKKRIYVKNPPTYKNLKFRVFVRGGGYLAKDLSTLRRVKRGFVFSTQGQTTRETSAFVAGYGRRGTVQQARDLKRSASERRVRFYDNDRWKTESRKTIKGGVYARISDKHDPIKPVTAGKIDSNTLNPRGVSSEVQREIVRESQRQLRRKGLA